MLLGDKKGRKFLLYVIGIALFIVLLPVIAVYGLFGWMAGDGGSDLIDQAFIYGQIPEEQRVIIEQYEAELEQITSVFTENELSQSDISQAKTIYISCLTGKETEDGFYQKYADCFVNQTEENDLLTNISSAFGVTFSDAERQQFENLYS